MPQKWEFGLEYQDLIDVMRRAKRENDNATIQRISPRLDELNAILWQSKIEEFPELSAYQTLVEALEGICHKNNLPFPNLDDREKNFTGKGDWRESGRFIFGVGSIRRSIQIFPMKGRGYIDIEAYDENRNCYKGEAKSIEESAIVLSRWYMQECSIEELHEQFPWMPIEPFKLKAPRIAFE